MLVEKSENFFPEGDEIAQTTPDWEKKDRVRFFPKEGNVYPYCTLTFDSLCKGDAYSWGTYSYPSHKVSLCQFVSAISYP